MELSLESAHYHLVTNSFLFCPTYNRSKWKRLTLRLGLKCYGPNEAILVTARFSFLSPYHAIKQLNLMALFHPVILSTSRLTSNELVPNILAK